MNDNNVKFINWLYPALIILAVLICSFALSHHCYVLLSDRGRELLLPQAILEGKVPYVDITLIYFPLAYYINALIYKVLGVSINSFFISQTFFATIYMLIFYNLSKEFLSKTTSLLITLLVIVCSIFAVNDLFSIIFPYSYARAYGIMSAITMVYFIVKLFKTHDIKFLYYAAFITGFSVCCKLEFFLIGFLLLIVLFLYEKLTIKQYVTIFLCFLVCPIVISSILLFQGVTIKHVLAAFSFAYSFAHTKVMTEFLTVAGMYPFKITNTILSIFNYLPILITIISFAFFALKLENKYKKFYFIPLVIFIIINCYSKGSTSLYFIVIPYLILGIFICKFKELYTNDKLLLFMIIASLCIGQREFFNLLLSYYGTFPFPIYLLTILILINRYVPKTISNIKVENIINFVLIVFIFMYASNLYVFKLKTNFSIVTNKGIIYTPSDHATILRKTLLYINKNVAKDKTILVLPEGNIINYLSDRKVDLHCYMMDRLYHDAYGEKIASEKIANTDSDYIILVQSADLHNFSRPYLYNDNVTLSSKYIARHYKKVKELSSENARVLILEKSKSINNKPIKLNQ